MNKTEPLHGERLGATSDWVVGASDWCAPYGGACILERLRETGRLQTGRTGPHFVTCSLWREAEEGQDGASPGDRSVGGVLAVAHT